MANVSPKILLLFSTISRRLLARRKSSSATEPLDLESYRLLVASLFSSPTSIVVSNVVGAAVPFFCWLATGAWFFFTIGAVAVVTITFRFFTLDSYCGTSHETDSLSSVKRWDREYFLGATVYSVILGLNCFAALVFTQSTPTHMITVVSAIAFSSGYVARNAGRPRFVILQLLFFCLPMAAGLFLSGQPYFADIGGFILLYVVTNISIVFSINRNLLALAAATNRSKRLAEASRKQNVVLDSALNSMTHALMMFDNELRLEVANSKFSELYGTSRDDIPNGMTLLEIAAVLVTHDVLSFETAQKLVEVAARSLNSAESGRLEFSTLKQQIFVVSIEPTQDDGILVTTEDATVRRALAVQFERMARYDGLTGLANRFTFGKALSQACDFASSDEPAAVFYIDLDNFKNINDSLGHEAGDKLLIQVADRLRGLAGPHDLVARFGGDEFVWLHIARDAAAMTFGQRVVDLISKPIEVGGATLYVTTSVGIAPIPAKGGEPAEVLRAADIALYAAKAAGRNQSMAFEIGMENALRERREIENDLRKACQDNSLTLHYQPIVELPTGSVTSCEALMRWRHPVRGMIGPSIFIPIAEQAGLIPDMGEWALRQACHDAMAWPENVSVAVNISAVQFKDPVRLIAAVKDALAASGLSPDRLELEVTESVLIENHQVTLDAMRTLRKLGVRFSLDDFGVGYSSLAYLAQYPFSKVKIDRSFTKDITRSGPSRSIIETVCRLARDLGLGVVVEGIETEEQRQEAEKLEIESAQGYLFGKPAPAGTSILFTVKAA